ncbi:MAG TPA: BatA domain-containing protein [Steroidobacteraceae bacterium]|jgi:hypothetical protein|nr:BatA domain-containing protein [Steroidobacteraceae bacterium]
MWLAPAFLVGLLAIGLPLWLHRFAKETQERQPFASLMLIEAGEVRRSRQHNLRYWLLLALRILLLALLALAFAGPLLPLPQQAGAARVSTLHVIVVDTSLSMRQDNRWTDAVTRARSLIDSLSGGDRGMLVAADHRLRVVQDPVFAGQASLLRGALAGLAPGLSRLDYGMLMNGAASWIGKQEQSVTLHLITDLQQSASPLRFADLQPPPGVQLDLIDVGAGSTANLRVAGLGLAPRDAGEIELRVTGEPAAAAAREIVVNIDGNELARRKLRDATLPLVESFKTGDLGEGEHRVTASLEPADSLPQDDRYYALLRRVEPRVLLVAASTSGDDAAYLAAALRSLANPKLRLEQSTAAALATRPLADFAALVISDVGILGSDAAAAVTRYVEAGGAVVMTLGDRALRLDKVPVGGQLLAAGRQRSEGNSPARVADVEQSHPVLRDPASWRSIRFFRHVPVVPGPTDQVLIRLENGSPLLLEQKLKSGRVLTLTSPLNRDWNDLAIHPLFVRFIAEATTYLAGTRTEALTATVGSVVQVSLNGRAGAQLFDPAGKRAQMLDAGAGELRLVPDQAGFYELRGGGRSEWVAVNVDPRESDLARLPDAAVERWRAMRAMDPAGEPKAGVPAQTGSSGPEAVRRLLPLWFWLLIAATVLAFCEPLVANYHLHVRRERSA